MYLLSQPRRRQEERLYIYIYTYMRYSADDGRASRARAHSSNSLGWSTNGRVIADRPRKYLFSLAFILRWRMTRKGGSTAIIPSASVNRLSYSAVPSLARRVSASSAPLYIGEEEVRFSC